MMKTISAKLDEETKSRMGRLFNTAHYVAKEGLAFRKFTGLCDLQEKNGLDMGTNYRNEMKCKEFVSSIGAIEQERCAKEIRDARFLCVLADGATDTSVTEQLTVFVRYTASNGRPSTQFSDLVPLQSGEANGITDAIGKGLEAIQVDENVLREKLVGCNFDGANVMMGAKGGVSKKLEDKVGHPLCIIHCVAHKLELAVLDAVKRCPYLRTFEDTVKEVYKFYYYSPKRRREVNEIANIIDEDAVYYSGLQKTRWLASRYRAITALEKHYVTTVMHLQHKTGSKNNEEGARAKGILKQLLSEKFVKHLYFLLDVMKILSELSKAFQQDQFCMTDVVATLEMTMTRLEELKLQRGDQYRKFQERYSEETATFNCGKDKGHTLQLTHPGNMLENQFDAFLSEVLTYLKSRFGNLQQKPYSLFSIFDPREMPQNLAAYGQQEIRSLVQYFGHLLTEKEQEGVLNQWPMLRTRLSRQKASNPVDVFSNLLASRPDDVKECIVLLDLMMTLSPSTAKCERSFSAMNQLKNSIRSRMSQGSLIDLMRVRSSDVSTKEFAPGPAISHWMLDGKQKRHIL